MYQCFVQKCFVQSMFYAKMYFSAENFHLYSQTNFHCIGLFVIWGYGSDRYQTSDPSFQTLTLGVLPILTVRTCII